MFLTADLSPWLSWLSYISINLLSLATFYDLTNTMDVFLLFSLTLLRNWKSAFRIVQSCNLQPSFKIVKGAAIAFIITQIASLLRKRSGTKINSSDGGSKPLFFPSRTTHTRFFPKSHSFSYSYMLVGIPVGWQGSVGGMLSADQGIHGARGGFQDGSSSSSWYTVNAGDYLDRGNRHLGLDGKLRKFIRSQGIRDEDYPYAYLVTAAKFLGYSFNPVSFWYLYSADRELSAMILEVNNTFDERHMYFLKPSEDPAEESGLSHVDCTALSSLPTKMNGTSILGITGPPRKPTRFTNTWAKEFHVSPFNSRKGTYSMVAYDPLYPSMSGRGVINSAITLKSSKAHSKLVARIFSEGEPVDPQAMSIWQKSKFLLSWWWVGFVTFPRIVREAGKLFFRRKLHVWFRPEPLKNSLGRHADATEEVLEASFRKYLRHLVESATTPLNVKYSAAGLRDASEETMISESGESNTVEASCLEVKVLTPVFYSRFVHYAHDLEAFFSEFNESGTIWLSQPSILPELVLRKPRTPHSIPNLVNYLCFKAIQNLRRRPAPIEGANTTTVVAKHKGMENMSDIRIFRLSAMDGYILAESTPAEQRKYRTEVLKLFISDRIALSSVDLLKVELFLLKCLIAWALVGSLSRL